jgi:hypothetical protein
VSLVVSLGLGLVLMEEMEPMEQLLPLELSRVLQVEIEGLVD